MAEFCHPEFGCDASECNGSCSITQQEWLAIYEAVSQVDDEFSFYVSRPAFPTPREAIEASERGENLKLRLRDLAGLS